MKYLTIFTLLFVVGACGSTAKERHQERQEEAREEYREAQEEANEKYYDEMIEEKKEEAIQRIEDSDKIKMDGDSIKVDD